MENSRLIIRKAAIADTSQLHSLIHQLGYAIPLPALESNMAAYFADSEKMLLVAEGEGRVVGCLALDMTQTFHREQRQMRVITLVVDQAHRGKGVGKELLSFAEGVAKGEGCWLVDLTSSTRREKEGTHDFYTAAGYHKNDSQAYFHKLL